MNTEEYPKHYLYKRIVQAKRFIDMNYADTIDIDNIADEAYFSKFHFIRLFKQIYGKTPYQYLTSVRIEKAIQLFQQDKGVSEVCFSVGFESISSFSGLFKRAVGISPAAYITQEQERKHHMSLKPLNYVPGCFAQRMIR
jgi:AraC-like DNA-binding protein